MRGKSGRGRLRRRANLINGGARYSPGGAAAAAAATAGGRWHFLSLLRLRDRVQTERKKSPGSLSPPPAFPSRFSGESHACRYLGWQCLRAGTERNRGSFICTVRRRGEKKKIPPVRLSRSSVYNFLSISAPLTKPPPPLQVTQMCSGAVSVKRQREKEMLQASSCK